MIEETIEEFAINHFALTNSDEKFFANIYRTEVNAKLLPHRLVRLMEVYQQDSTRRIHAINEMRFMYEESPHYEQGYVMAEIIERYRKMVEHVKRPLEFPSDYLFAILKRTELIQKLYFEIQHLVHMAHEIARKYKFMPEFVNLEETVEIHQIYMEQAEEKVKQKIEAQEKRKKDKFMNKLNEFLQKNKDRKKPTKPYNRWWPLDYGWEIDTLW